MMQQSNSHLLLSTDIPKRLFYNPVGDSSVGGQLVKFNDYDLGYRSAGSVVEATLSGNAANVRLLDSSEFQSYKSGRQHRYYGGHYTQSPVRIQIPYNGNWHVVIDLGGYAGSVQSSVRVL